ncbi:blastula protease 10-like [Artemia franciscana]|uniref:Metalloendopeptidase n=1 Tax=Artemia franciscana TaxID=6661 RepID=A0AA88HDK5_ARTSF|nr:hypothetical protein QYM36_014948 [Artemia franciscana]
MNVFHVLVLSLSFAVCDETIEEYANKNIFVSLRSKRSVATREPLKYYVGDMVFNEESWLVFNSPVRKVIFSEQYRWPKDENGDTILPYEIDSTFTGNISAIDSAISDWSEKTCVRFYELSDPNLPEGKNSTWIKIQSSGPRICNSYVGKVLDGPQPLNLGDGCDTKETATHEIGHALGFFHEHQRQDRNEYLKIFLSNVETDRENNFEIPNGIDNFDVPYDYLSNMHYSWNAFGTDRSKPTMLPVDITKRYLLTSKNPLGHFDALAANRAFLCLDKWSSNCGTSSPTCLNHGYLGPACTCKCPPGTSGSDCGTVIASSIPAYPDNPCGGKIQAPGSFAVEGMGGPRSAGLYCTWYVEAPVCKIAEVTIYDFSTYDTDDPTCIYERLSVASEDIYYPNIGPFCGKSTVVPDGTKYTGSPSISLFYRSLVNYGGGAGGFRFNVSYDDDPSCTSTTSSTTTEATPLIRCQYTKLSENFFSWTSPNYPDPAPSTFQCSLLAVTNSTGFVIRVEEFDLPEETNCNTTYVSFASSFPIQKDCDIFSGKEISTLGNWVLLNFISSEVLSISGFNITLTPS